MFKVSFVNLCFCGLRQYWLLTIEIYYIINMKNQNLQSTSEYP